MPFYLSDSLPTLLLTFPGGDSNEYRVRQGCVEFRANHGAWLALDEPDLQLHFALNTEVAKWLQKRKAVGPALSDEPSNSACRSRPPSIRISLCQRLALQNAFQPGNLW